MANPGPAVTTSAHPSNVTTSQTVRLLGSAKGVNANATGYTSFPVINSSNYTPTQLFIANANNGGAAVTASSTVLSITTAGNTGGSTIFSGVTATGNSTILGLTANTIASPTTTYAGQNLFVNVTTAAGTAATLDVYVYGLDFSTNS
jgi:hypothetical protein